MKQMLVRIFNYFFPLESFEGRKITTAKWFQRFIPFAPYTVIIIAAFMLIWGIGASNQTRFFIKPQFISLLGLIFWISLIAIVVKMMRKRRRDPAFFLLIASFIAIRGLFALIMFTAIHPMIQKAKVQMQSKQQQFSQEVREKLQSHKSSWDDHSARLQKRSQEIQGNVARAFSELDSRMESRLDRFWRKERENDAAFWKIVAENRAKSKEFDKAFWKSGEGAQKRVHKWKREWCRTHSLSQMCKNLPPDPDEVAITQKEEAISEKETTNIDLPLFFKYEIRE